MTSRVPSSAIDLRIAHLGMIQGVIGRMSGFSASAKNFCITICAAIIAVGFQNRSALLIWAALGVVILFFLMDSYYLSLERRYRDLYEQVTKRTPEPEPNMSLRAVPLTLGDFARAMTSVSVLPFYTLLMASMIGLLYVATHVQHASSETTAVGPRSPTGTAKASDGKRALPDGPSIGRPEDRKQRIEPVRPTSADSVRAR